jgi:hypothetical protein
LRQFVRANVDSLEDPVRDRHVRGIVDGMASPDWEPVAAHLVVAVVVISHRALTVVAASSEPPPAGAHARELQPRHG